MTLIYGDRGRWHSRIVPEVGPLLDGARVDWTTPDGEVIPTPRALIDLVAHLQSLRQRCDSGKARG